MSFNVGDRVLWTSLNNKKFFAHILHIYDSEEYQSRLGDNNYIIELENCTFGRNLNNFLTASKGLNANEDSLVLSSNQTDIKKSTCDITGKLLPKNVLKNIKVDGVIKNISYEGFLQCYKCEYCSEFFQKDIVHLSVPNTNEYFTKHVCKEHSSLYKQCSECGKYFLSREIVDGLCACCRQPINVYHQSHSKPIVFFGDNKNNSVPFLGMELEVDADYMYDEDEQPLTTSEVAYKIKKIFPKKFICQEYDGSLEYGFENITQPATLEYHKTLLPLYKEMIETWVDNGLSSQFSSCGLHVHFNRDFFGETEVERDDCILRLLFLFEKFWDDITVFSRRNYDDIEQWAKRYNEKPEEVLKMSKENDVDRYQAVNLTNENTIEFRVFAGTDNPYTILDTLTFCHNIVTISKNTKDVKDLQKLKWDDIINIK